jgi:hypothetical protein
MAAGAAGTPFRSGLLGPRRSFEPPAGVLSFQNRRAGYGCARPRTIPSKPARPDDGRGHTLGVVRCNACALGTQIKGPATRAATEELTRCGRGYRHHDARCCYSLCGHWVVVAGRASGAAVRQQANRLEFTKSSMTASASWPSVTRMVCGSPGYKHARSRTHQAERAIV